METPYVKPSILMLLTEVEGGNNIIAFFHQLSAMQLVLVVLLGINNGITKPGASKEVASTRKRTRNVKIFRYF